MPEINSDIQSKYIKKRVIYEINCPTFERAYFNGTMDKNGNLGISVLLTSFDRPFITFNASTMEEALQKADDYIETQLRNKVMPSF